jgi:hypothetical protein
MRLLFVAEDCLPGKTRLDRLVPVNPKPRWNLPHATSMSFRASGWRIKGANYGHRAF